MVLKLLKIKELKIMDMVRDNFSTFKAITQSILIVWGKKQNVGNFITFKNYQQHFL